MYTTAVQRKAAAVFRSNSARAMREAQQHGLSANSGSRPYSITSSARAAFDQLRRKPWPRRSTRRKSIARVAGAILVNAPTLGGWYLLQGPAVAISHTTGIYALLLSGLSRREGEGGEIARIECSRTQ
jgi:hypothetical protein